MVEPIPDTLTVLYDIGWPNPTSVPALPSYSSVLVLTLLLAGIGVATLANPGGSAPWRTRFHLKNARKSGCAKGISGEQPESFGGEAEYIQREVDCNQGELEQAAAGL